MTNAKKRKYFNPQGPHGPRQIRIMGKAITKAFQSTRPSRASTAVAGLYAPGTGISIHKALTGLDAATAYSSPAQRISIHKALTGLDSAIIWTAESEGYFNPQGPHGPRRSNRAASPTSRWISIHKALTGLDLRSRRSGAEQRHFNPQGPHGPRRSLSTDPRRVSHFNPQGPHGPRPTRPKEARNNE